MSSAFLCSGFRNVDDDFGVREHAGGDTRSNVHVQLFLSKTARRTLPSIVRIERVVCIGKYVDICTVKN